MSNSGPQTFSTVEAGQVYIERDASSGKLAVNHNAMVAYFGAAGQQGVTQVTTGTGLVPATITSTGTVALADTAVTPGTYDYASITVDQQGRLTAASSNAQPFTQMHFFNVDAGATGDTHIGNGLRGGAFATSTRQTLLHDALLTRISVTHATAPGAGESYTFELRDSGTPITSVVVSDETDNDAVTIATGLSVPLTSGMLLTVFVTYSAGANVTANFFSVMIELLPQ